MKEVTINLEKVMNINEFIDWMIKSMEKVTVFIGSDQDIPHGMVEQAFVVRRELAILKKQMEVLQNEAD